MKNLIFSFGLAFFLFSFSALAQEPMQDVIKRSPVAEPIVELVEPASDKDPCPPCPLHIKKIPVKKSTIQKAILAPLPIINIIGSDYDHVEVINNGEGFKLVVDKKKPVLLYQENDPLLPIYGEDVDSNPGLISPSPNPGTYPTPPNPGNGKGVFGGEGPAFLFGVLIALAGMVLYFLGKIPNKNSTGPDSIKNGTEFKSRNRDGYRKKNSADSSEKNPSK